MHGSTAWRVYKLKPHWPCPVMANVRRQRLIPRRSQRFQVDAFPALAPPWSTRMSKANTDPFKSTVRREFAFLVDEFNFTEAKAPKDGNEYAVWFVNQTTRIVVESINWGANARVALGSADADGFENYDLLDYVTVHSPDLAIDHETLPLGALAQLTFMAETLRKFASPVLHGNFTLFSGVQKIIDKRQLDWESNH